MNDQFKGDWDAYLLKINTSSPVIQALGVTDYFCIRTYQAVKKRWENGELPQVGFLFPNVEMRLDIKTEKKLPINLHLLFSPEDAEHEQHIERILRRLQFDHDGRIYQCTPDQFITLGRALDSSLPEQAAMKAGAQQFKVDLNSIKNLFSTERWLQRNCLVAVSGSSNDGTAGLQGDDSYALTRKEIERFSDVIFAGTPSQRDFWLGDRAGFDPEFIERHYRCLKPCLHGSDGHNEATTASPAKDRFCWIKGDLIFESLRQVVLEPRRRVSIGEAPPLDGGGANSIRQARFEHANWLTQAEVTLNTGLVAIIGARGSGKSALVEMLAHGAGCSKAVLSKSSFLTRAAEHLEDESVQLDWNNGDVSDALLLRAPNEDDWLNVETVRYLSQQFVERLCSGPGLAVELRQEIERVVFESLEPSQRFQASSFEELLTLLNEPIHERRSELREHMDIITDAIVTEDKLIAGLRELREERKRQGKNLANARSDLAKLVPKDAMKHASRLAALETAFTASQLGVEGHRRRLRSLRDLRTEVKNHRDSGGAAGLTRLRSRYTDANLAPQQWAKFILQYGTEADEILVHQIAATESAINLAINGAEDIEINVNSTPLAEWHLKLLEKERDAVKLLVGIDAEQQKKYGLLQRQISVLESTLTKTDSAISRSETAEQRRAEHLESRRKIYRQIFDTFSQQEETLGDLYAPLKSQLVGGSGALGKLRFVITRRVDLDAWIERGEKLLDLRKATPFKGEGALREIAERELLSVWRSGIAEAVSVAMHAFLERYRNDFRVAMPGSITPEGRKEWIQSLAAWLYDTSHIELVYSLTYSNLAIEKLSPGTRGIVLLLLYLVLDKTDLRPLIIDQPEENLDPQSVFDELVPHFREARSRRQVIIVTHNANLVVNTDSDQVIVATARTAERGLPSIAYASGSLENAEIRKQVCSILEGGERAFMDRARRYRFVLK